MKHKVIVTGILKKNGEMAHYGDILDSGELISPNDSLDGGFTEPYEEKSAADLKKESKEAADKAKAADDQAKADQKAADDKVAADAKAEADRLAKEADDKVPADQKAIDDAAAANGDGKSAADLLNAAKAK